MTNITHWLEGKGKFDVKPIYFCFFWLCLNLVQAATLNLTSDEAYYWFYTRSLEWGYYDHPPMIALVVKMGYSLFQNALGVRLIYVLLNSISVYLLFTLIDAHDVKRQRLIYLIILSLPLFNYLSFLVFPDGPFLFFVIVFLISYKRFLERNNWAAALLMALAAALMMYSKYHAVLVVGFTVLSNLKLLRSVKFYTAMFMALLLFMPHLWWQYTHHFATFQYHLHGRSSALSTKHVFEYISQQIGALGPALLFLPFIYTSKNQWERTLQFITIGTLGFFLFSSFKNFIHFHWTSLTIFPLILIASLCYPFIKRKKLFLSILVSFAFLILIFRLQLIFHFLPINHAGIDYFYGRNLWAEDIERIAGNRPVFFRSNFRESSLYTFYSGKMGVSLQTGEKRKSQYEIWHYEDSLQHKEVVLVRDEPSEVCTPLPTRMGKTAYYTLIPDFTSYYDVEIEVNFPNQIKKGSEIKLELILYNRRSSVIGFRSDSTGSSPSLFYSIRKDNKEMLREKLYSFNSSDSIPEKGKLKVPLTLNLSSLEAGEYNIVLGFSRYLLDDSFNSKAYQFTID